MFSFALPGKTDRLEEAGARIERKILRPDSGGVPALENR
jgi:hypothetical protein